MPKGHQYVEATTTERKTLGRVFGKQGAGPISSAISWSGYND